MYLVVFATAILVIQPFKANVNDYSTITAGFILLLALFYVSVSGIEMAVYRNPNLIFLFLLLTTISVFLPFLYLLFIIMCKFECREFVFKTTRRLKAWINGYTTLS